MAIVAFIELALFPIAPNCPVVCRNFLERQATITRSQWQFGSLQVFFRSA